MFLTFLNPLLHKKASANLQTTLFWTTGQNVLTANGRFKQQTARYLKWAKNWKIKINASKSQALATKRRPIPQRTKDKFNIAIDAQKVRYKNQIKYLGYIIDTKLTPKTHLKQVIRNTRTRTKVIYTLANTTYKAAPPNIITHFYKALVRPYKLYATPLLTHSTEKEVNTLELLERHLLRKAYHLPR